MKIKLLFSILFIAITMQAQTNNNRTEPDFEGKTARYFYYDDEIYVNTVGYTKRNLLEEQVYFMDNNEVYLREFIDFIGFIKGIINKETGTITIKNGQEMGTKQLEASGATHKIYFATMNPTTKEPEQGEFTLKYIDKGNGDIYIDGGTLCFSLYYLDKGKPTIYFHTKGLKMMNKTFLDGKIQKATYEYTNNYEGEGDKNEKVDCIKYGENIYFKPLEAAISDKWQVGKIIKEGDKMALFIPTDQYVGYMNDDFFIFKAAKVNKDAKVAVKNMSGLKMPMTYNENTHTYKCVAANDEMLGAAYYQTKAGGLNSEWVSMYENISITIPETQVVSGITTLTHSKQESIMYYDLQGRAYKHPGKGIYIHKGKKIVIK